MSEEYTVDNLRGFFAAQGPAAIHQIRLNWIDRWLEAHDREVASKAWGEGYQAGSEDQAECEGHRYWPSEKMISRGFDHWAENPYKNGETL